MTKIKIYDTIYKTYVCIKRGNRMKKRINVLVMLLVSISFFTACRGNNQPKDIVQETAVTISTADTTEQKQGTAQALDGLEAVEVAQVVDGDTIRIMKDGKKVTIRMIGIDTPESVHPDKSKNTVFGDKASDYTKACFTEGQTIYLEKDVSDTDKYGRLLRYIWLEKPDDTQNEEEIREKMFNAIVVSDGYANAYYYAPDTKHYELFSQLEWEAYIAQAGLWSENGLNDENVKAKENQEKSINDLQEGIVYIGNKNSKKFHVSTCHSLPKESNAIYFETREEAIKEGYEPCGICHP